MTIIHGLKMTQPLTRRFLSTGTKPRHLLSIQDLTTSELAALVSSAAKHKALIKSGAPAPAASLAAKTVALIFSKRSTRTRVSTEGAVHYFGGLPMFLGKDDIQLGVNESLYDTSRVISSMVSCIFARVGKHAEIAELSESSSVPVINALCDMYHPLQAITDVLTIKEAFGLSPEALADGKLKLAWIGDANNVINDLAIACVKSGISVTVATPTAYEFDEKIASVAQAVAQETGATFETTHDPLAAVKDANILVTDTFVSMGEEAKTQEKLKQFAGFKVTKELATKGGAKDDWIFMHCLPRHKEEVDDEVFYSDRSVVFPEAENRLYAAIAALEGFVINKGKLV